MTERAHNYQGKGLSPEKIVRMRALVEKGLSSAAIATALGTTKGTIIGTTRRLGIQLKLPPGYSRPAGQHPKNGNPSGWSGVPKRVAAPPRPPNPPLRPKDAGRYVPSLPAVRPVAAPVPLMKLGRRSCRYIGERPELLTLDSAIYCGAQTDGGSWCPEHRARCLVPLRRFI
jgi:hypothetical protein